MKTIFNLTLLIIMLASCSESGPYDTSANASINIQKALTNAKVANVPTIIVFSANWCADCRALDQALSTGQNAEKIKHHFKVIKVNVGNFNTNLDISKKYGNPISGGIPGAAILSPASKLLYVAKPGELSTIRKNGRLYEFFSQRSLSAS
jgi:thioredoxin 1